MRAKTKNTLNGPWFLVSNDLGTQVLTFIVKDGAFFTFEPVPGCEVVWRKGPSARVVYGTDRYDIGIRKDRVVFTECSKNNGCEHWLDILID